MTWLRLDDDMLDHPKWVRALRDGGSAAIHLWMRLACWCSRQRTDGLVPGNLVGDIGKIGRSKRLRRALAALLEQGLCEHTADGSLRVNGAQSEREPARNLKIRKAIGDRLRYRILLRDGFSCRYCGAGPERDELVIDHVHPVSAGGSNDPSNLVTACRTCNSGKGALVSVTEVAAG